MEELEYIEQYFQGPIQPEEKSRFEKKLQEDPAFAEEVALYLSMQRVLKAQAREEKKAQFKALYRQNQPQAVVRPLRRLWVYIAAAAVLVVLAGIYLLRPPTPTQLANRYINRNFSTLSVTMSEGQDDLQPGIQLYNEGKYREALQLFEGLVQARTTHFNARKYAGIAALRVKDYDRALGHFRQLERQEELYANPARFYQALTLMKRDGPGDRQQARQLLQQVVAQNGEGKQTAADWLKKLP